MWWTRYEVNLIRGEFEMRWTQDKVIMRWGEPQRPIWCSCCETCHFNLSACPTCLHHSTHWSSEDFPSSHWFKSDSVTAFKFTYSVRIFYYLSLSSLLSLSLLSCSPLFCFFFLSRAQETIFLSCHVVHVVSWRWAQFQSKADVPSSLLAPALLHWWLTLHKAMLMNETEPSLHSISPACWDAMSQPLSCKPTRQLHPRWSCISLWLKTGKYEAQIAVNWWVLKHMEVIHMVMYFHFS